MIKNYSHPSKLILIYTVLLLCSSVLMAQVPSSMQVIRDTFNYSGSIQTFTVPICVSTLTLEVNGSQGGSNAGSSVAGGFGGTAYGVLTVTPGQVLNIFVGNMNGFNGGGLHGTSPCTSAIGGNGGGASDIRLNGIGLTNRIVVAGGGGGAGGNRVFLGGRGTGGGGGGGYFGGGGGCGFPQSSTVVPTAGTPSVGGAGGVSGYSASQNGTAGSLGTGGNGGNETISLQNNNHLSSPGGNGGGLSGLNGQSNGIFAGQSGAGGSSYLGTLTNTYTVAGNRLGDGLVVISYKVSTPIAINATSTLICVNSSVALSTTSLLTYSWSTGSNSHSISVSPTADSTYFFNGTTNSNCPVDGVVTITVSATPPVLSLVNNVPAICPDHTVVLTASGALTYTWSSNTGNSVSNGLPFTPSVTGSYVVAGSNGCGITYATTGITLTPLPVTITAPTLVCNGTAATLTAGGATTYTWFPNLSTGSLIYANPNASAIYTLSGKTGSCSGTATVAITVNPNPTLTISASNSVVCSGSLTTINVTGAPSYSWSNGATGSSIAVTPTTVSFYTATGTNSLGCTGTASQIILVHAAPPITALVADSLICAGDTVQLIADSAATYLWETGSTAFNTFVSPLTTTSYSVIGTNSLGCGAIAIVTVNVFSPAIIVSSNTTVCFGTAVTLGANADGAESFTWTPNLTTQYISVTPSVSTVYTVNATINNGDSLSCRSSNTVMITINANPVIAASASHPVICHRETATLTASGAITYTWNEGVVVVSAPNITVSPLTTTVYSVTGTDQNGCSGTALVTLTVANCVGIPTYAAADDLTIYPNPSNGEFAISSPQAVNLLILNETGQQVKSVSIDDTNTAVKISDLASGIYFITGKNENGFVRKKLIIAR